GKCAERSRNAPRLDIDRPILPGMHAYIERVRTNALTILTTHFAEKRDAIAHADIGGEAEAHQPHRVVLVIGVVEPGRLVVLRGRRQRDIGAERDAPARERDGPVGQLLRTDWDREPQNDAEHGCAAQYAVHIDSAIGHRPWSIG